MTAQSTESLLYKKENLQMCSTPLDVYLLQNNIRFEAENTANWRGYQGSWEIKGSEEVGYRLYLISLTACLKYPKKVGLDYLFPEFPNGVFAHWFSGEIRCPRGDRLHYVHGGYASIYEEDLFLEFQEGVLKGTRVVKNQAPTPIAQEDLPWFLRSGGKND
jgi:hypothetical protein